MKIEVDIPDHHLEVAEQMAKDADLPLGRILAQGIAVIQCLYEGIWRIENNYDHILQARGITKKLAEVQDITAPFDKAVFNAGTEDTLFYMLGIGKYGQSDFECKTMPMMIRRAYKAISNTPEKSASEDRPDL